MQRSTSGLLIPEGAGKISKPYPDEWTVHEIRDRRGQLRRRVCTLRDAGQIVIPTSVTGAAQRGAHRFQRLLDLVQSHSPAELRAMGITPRFAGGDRQYGRAVEEPAGSQLVADPTAITGTAEALMWPAALTAIGANTLKQGMQIQLTAFGVATTPAAGATAMTINPRYGTTTAGVSLGISNTPANPPISQTNVPWFMEWSMTVRSFTPGTASSMTLVGGGNFTSIVAGTVAAPGTLVFGGTVVTNADQTSAQGLVFGAILGGSASFTLTTRGVVFEYLN